MLIVVRVLVVLRSPLWSWSEECQVGECAFASASVMVIFCVVVRWVRVFVISTLRKFCGMRADLGGIWRLVRENWVLGMRV